MTTLTEGAHSAEFILSEAAGTRSRDNGVIVSGQGKLLADTVLGKITASGKFAKLTAGAVDGSQNAAAILIGAVDATSADAPGAVIARDAEANVNLLTWDASITVGAVRNAKIAQLAALGIIVR
jgi:Bacteriophage lambda head decoration protein D